MPQLEPYKGDYYLWQYVPSVAASIIFLFLFSALTAFHCWKAWKARSRLCIPFCIGALFEIIGYAARAACYNDTAALIPYCIQNVFILLGPVFFAASVYMALGRIIRSIHAERYSVIPVKWLTKTFVTSDVISFLVQGTGAGMMSAGGSMMGLAKAVVIAGLSIHMVMFGLFMVTLALLDRRTMHRVRTATADAHTTWKRDLIPLYIISALIMARSIFRVIEYAMGQQGYLLSHEWCMYLFDSVLMCSVMVVWGIRHPTSIATCPSPEDDFGIKNVQDKS